MSTYINCGFAGASGTVLNGYTGDSGITWPTGYDYYQGTASLIKLDGNGFVFNSSASASVIRCSTTASLPTTLNYEVIWQMKRISLINAIDIGPQLCASNYGAWAQDLSISFVDSSTTPSWNISLESLNAASTSSTSSATYPSTGGTYIYKAVVSTVQGQTTVTVFYSSNVSTPSWTQFMTLTFNAPAMPCNPGLRCTGTAATATTGCHLGGFIVRDITPTAINLSGHTTGALGGPTEFYATLIGPNTGSVACCPAGGDVITPTSANGSDTFTATPGGAVITTFTIPAGQIGPVTFYLNPSGTSARNISISDGNGLSAPAAISFTPSANLLDPTQFSFQQIATWQPNALLDPNRVLLNAGNFSGITLTTYNLGFSAPTVVGNSSGITITSTAASQLAVVALPTSYYPSHPKAVIQLTVGSVSTAGGGTLQWGPCLIRTDASYPGSNANFQIVNANGGIQAGYRVSNSVAGAPISQTTGIAATTSHFTEAGTVISGVFCDNVGSLFYRPVGGVDQFVPSLSFSTVNTTANGTELSSVLTGACDQRDPLNGGTLTLGIIFYSTASGNSINISNVATGYFGGGSTREHFPVLRTSNGAPYTDGNGNILITLTQQAPSIDGTHNVANYWGCAWYYPATQTIGPILTRFCSSRASTYTPATTGIATRLCSDGDGVILYEDRPGNSNYGKWLVFTGATGTDYQYMGTTLADNTLMMWYQVVNTNITSGYNNAVLSSQTQVTLPATYYSPYDVKFLQVNGTWYAAGMCSTTTQYSANPTSPFIVSGASPTSLTTVILAPTNPFQSQTNWDSCTIFRYQGTWYVLFVSGAGCLCYNLITGAYIGTMTMSGVLTPFKFHASTMPVQFMANGLPCRRYDWLTHDDNFVQWGQDWSFGGTKYNTWVFGDLAINHGPIIPGLEFQPAAVASPALLGP